jgi:Cu2+-exporting ATPase
VNPVSGEAAVRFDTTKLAVSAVLDGIARLGFTPRPGEHRQGAAEAAASRGELKRLAVAGLGFMQVMTLSTVLYVAEFKPVAASYVSLFAIASLLISTPVVLYSGAPIFRSAVMDLKAKRLGMDVPVALAIAVALAASIVNALRGAGHVYFDSATMFVFFLTLGRFLEARARHQAGGVFDALADLRPLAASRRCGTLVERVGTIELEIGDCVVVEPGGALPADGELLSARGSFDEALLSGESLPRTRRRGDTVLGGSVNVGREPVDVLVTKLGADSYLDRVGTLLHRAIADRPQFLQLADRWAGGFVAGILLLTAIAGAAWLFVAPERAFEVVLAMLVVTCPCALSLAAPTAFAVALGRLARHGLLLRSARVLERLERVDAWLFDKTGTLTEGRITVQRVTTHGSLSAEECLRVAAALEAGIDHPIARALRADGAAAAAQSAQYLPGFGVTGRVAGREYSLGSPRHVGESSGADTPQCVYLSDADGLLARIDLADTLRPHARDALASLQAAGAELRLVSGDEPGAVRAAARELGIARFHAAQTPDRKLDLVREWQSAGRIVAAVGDGINDAPLLARADVSIALVAGSKLAQASADIVFTGGDLRLLARLPEWAAATRRIVRQNLAWAAVYNFVAVGLAATGMLTPWMAAIGMSLSSIAVVANALRLNRALGGQPAAAALAGAARLVEARSA